MNYYLHGREVTIELSYDKIPADSSLDDYWNYNKESFLQFIGQVFSGVTGVVTDSVTGLPVHAMVGFQYYDKDNSQVYTDPSNGNFYRLAIPGKYTLEITASGYQGKTLKTFVSSGNLSRIDIQLSPLPVSLLYPNPFFEDLYVNITDPGESLVLEFVDLSGRKVKRITQQVPVAGIQDISIGGLASGVYIASFTYKNRTTRQVVVRRF